MTEEGGGDQGFFDPRHRLLPHRGLSLIHIYEIITAFATDCLSHGNDAEDLIVTRKNDLYGP